MTVLFFPPLFVLLFRLHHVCRYVMFNTNATEDWAPLSKDPVALRRLLFFPESGAGATSSVDGFETERVKNQQTPLLKHTPGPFATPRRRWLSLSLTHIVLVMQPPVTMAIPHLSIVASISQAPICVSPVPWVAEKK